MTGDRPKLGEAVANKRGLLITFEGGDGSGKTTQARLLAERLMKRTYSVVTTFEPGGTPLGLQVRELLLNTKIPIRPLTRLLLFFAARAENVETVIKPALARGDIVICDRFIDSSAAYQGYGEGLSREKIRQLAQIVTNGLVPDITLLLDVDPKTSLQRLAAEGDRIGGHLQLGFSMGEPLDGHKREGGWEPEVHERIRAGYRALATEEPARWHVLNGTLPPGRIANMVWARVEPLLCARGLRKDTEDVLSLQPGQP